MCETKRMKYEDRKHTNMFFVFRKSCVVTIHYSFLNKNNLEIYTFLNSEFKMVTLKFEFDQLQRYFQVCKHA